jgi:hypothetical protein
MKNLKIKLIKGYREDQYSIIDAEEAHKAFYLFLNPSERGAFSNGVLAIGADIKDIQPAWNETMGWNPLHKINTEDWNEIRSCGLEAQMIDVVADARALVPYVTKNKNLLSKPMSEVVTLAVVALAEKNLLN